MSVGHGIFDSILGPTQLPPKEHRDALPDHVPPIAMPETEDERRLVILSLETGYFPRLEEKPTPTDDQQ